MQCISLWGSHAHFKSDAAYVLRAVCSIGKIVIRQVVFGAGKGVSHRRSARSVHRHYIYYYCFQELVAWNISIMPELLSSSIRAVRVDCSKANRILPCLPPTVIPCDPARLLRPPSLPPYHVPLRVYERVSLHSGIHH